jgi:formylglycine-generating enzyme required for sulfatase activity
MAEKAWRYRAFISYSQKDKPEARRLQRWLETWRTPVGLEPAPDSTRRLGKFFRDDEDMSAAADIGATVRGAIDEAESLIVLCSPQAAHSKWVNAEINHFRRTERAGKVFAVIIRGTPNSGDPKTECFPLALQAVPDAANLNAMPIEPLALDMRREGRARVCARLAAGLLDVRFDDLWQRERRRRRATLIWSALLAVILLSVGAALVFQDELRPAFVQYTRYWGRAKSAEAVAAMPDLAAFQDCTPHSNDCPVMVIVPGGRFQMGASDSGLRVRDTELPLHEAAVGRFAVSRYEITFAQWQACVDAGGCRSNPTPSDFGWGRGNRPVVNITWENAREYVQWLSRMTGQSYRLLSEAQWEYAARAPRWPADHTKFPWGDQPPPLCDPRVPSGVRFADCGQGTSPVGSFQPNRFGLYDVVGNVWEWVEDCSSANLRPTTGAAIEVAGECQLRIFRGGGWDNRDYVLPLSTRQPEDPSNEDNDLGLRVARILTPTRSHR